MVDQKDIMFDELIRVGSLLSNEIDLKTLISVLVEQTQDISSSDLAALYFKKNPDDINSPFINVYQRGKYEAQKFFSPQSELFDFLIECNEAVVLLEKKESPFEEILLNNKMNSGIALPVSTPKAFLGAIILNSRSGMYYNRLKLNFLESFTNLAAGMLNNSRLHDELKLYLKEIEGLKIYQENIFSSMTNLLITTDKKGGIKYFNTAAKDRFSLNESCINTNISEYFKPKVGNKIVKIISEVNDKPKEVLGIEGIYKRKEVEDIDFSLNISPLKGSRRLNIGNTFLFTDQTRERELQNQMTQIVEERRVIKDMFARYLSTEIVQTLTESPHLVKPGGDKKTATIFFADIRGYTSFSEGKDPEYIIDILNEYFNEAVEIVIETKGYIDKFIGDCIMAAWGVPLQTEQQDAISGVSCALQIQNLVNSKSRKFWKGAASNLSVGIGMHSGPIVAGNLGSSRRMNYTVIGDTVNIAARLEGVAGPGEVIITKDTYEYIKNDFKAKQLKPVKVKGKEKPLEIFSVTDFK